MSKPIHTLVLGPFLFLAQDTGSGPEALIWTRDEFESDLEIIISDQGELPTMMSEVSVSIMDWREGNRSEEIYLGLLFDLTADMIREGLKKYLSKYPDSL